MDSLIDRRWLQLRIARELNSAELIIFALNLYDSSYSCRCHFSMFSIFVAILHYFKKIFYDNLSCYHLSTISILVFYATCDIDYANRLLDIFAILFFPYAITKSEKVGARGAKSWIKKSGGLII